MLVDSELVVEVELVVFDVSLAPVVFALESLEDEVLVVEFDEVEEDTLELELALVLEEVVEEVELVALEEIVPVLPVTDTTGAELDALVVED